MVQLPNGNYADQVQTVPKQSAAGANTSVTAAAADTALLAANASRSEMMIFNESASATLYLQLGTGAASVTNYSTQIAPNALFTKSSYTGAVRGIWSAAVGAARITEFT